MIDSMSRWFVGSSISSTSGRPSSTRAIATRIFQPPESAPTSPSIRSSSKPRPCRTSRAWRFERVAAEVLVLLLHLAEAREDPVHVVGPGRGRPSRAAAPRARGAGRRRGRCRQSPRRAPTAPTSLRRPAGSSRSSVLFGTDTSPSSGDSSPTIMRKSVVLPAPFGPTSPTFSPGLSWNEASTNRTWRPYCLLMRDSAIIEPARVPRPAPQRGMRNAEFGTELERGIRSAEAVRN